MGNIKLIVAYKGTDFLGWQKTKEGPSIEEALEKALLQIYHVPVVLQAASRTDRGVHARGQVVNFFMDNPPCLSSMQKSLNAVLPRAISVTQVESVRDDFHPTLDAKEKEYHYFLCLAAAQLPFYRLTSWHVPQLKELCPGDALLGTHDFSAFCNESKNPKEDKKCTLTAIDYIPLEHERLCISIKGSHFLYKMVRNIVGTLVYKSLGKITDPLEEILRSKERRLAGVTAPAHGLFLKAVRYKENN